MDKSGFFPKDDRIIGDAFVPEAGKDELGITITRRPDGSDGNKDERPPGMGTQVSLLFQREIKNLQRDVTAVGARFGLTTFLGILIGIIFYDVGAADSAVNSNLQSHFGALVMVLLMSMFGTAQPALLSFPDERPVFLREYSTNHYSAVAYFISRFSIEATITGAQVLWMVSCTSIGAAFSMVVNGAHFSIYSFMAATAFDSILHDRFPRWLYHVFRFCLLAGDGEYSSGGFAWMLRRGS